MSEESEKSGMITDAAKAIAAITENVPIYEDAIQPAAQELGKSLHLVVKAINTALLPVEVFVWGVEQIKSFVHDQVAKKLENVPPEDIQAPRPHIGVPTIDALRYTGAEKDLADLYANLLATSMDRVTAYRAHPGFVDVIKNMTPDEARIMRFLSTHEDHPLIDIRLLQADRSAYEIAYRHVSLLGLDANCEHDSLSSNYIDNLERLGLVKVNMATLHDEDVYKRISEFPETKHILDTLGKEDGRIVDIARLSLGVTDFGKQFLSVCVIDKEKQERG